jgi:pimeloyl-ACP methyl ester carboxylesterase
MDIRMHSFRNRVAVAVMLVQICTAGTPLSAQQETLPRRGDLGVTVSALSDTGVRVTQIRSGSAAADAGLRAGDVILKINDAPLRGDEGEASVDRVASGEVKVTLRRGAAEETKTINAPVLPPEKFSNADVILDAVRGGKSEWLRTVLTRPRGREKVPVTFVVGWLSCDSVEYPYGPGNDGFGIFLTRLAEQSGFATLRMDKPGVGDSEGVCSKADFADELAGYRAAFASLRKYDFIDQQRIFVLGLSNGGGVAPLVVPEGSAVKGYVSISGWGRSWFEHMIEHERRRLTLKGASPAEVTRQLELFEKFYSLYLLDKMTPGDAIAREPALKEIWYDASDAQYGRPAAFYQQLQDLNLAQAWSRVNAPVLVIHGAQDWVMSHADAEGISESVNRVHPGAAQFIELPQANHGLMDHAAIEDQFQHRPGKFHDQTVDVVIQWLRQQAQGR